MSYSVALIFFHVSLQFHRKSAIKLMRGGVVSHSNIVQQVLRRTDTEKCLMVSGLGQVGLKIDATLIACNKTCDI